MLTNQGFSERRLVLGYEKLILMPFLIEYYEKIIPQYVIS